MRRILLDEGVSAGVRAYLTGFSVEVVPQIGWAGKTNGELIAAAEEAGFDIMVTADQNIRYQQNLTNRRISLVVLTVNHWPTLRANIGRIVTAVETAGVGTYTTVTFPRPPKRRRPYNPTLER